MWQLLSLTRPLLSEYDDKQLQIINKVFYAEMQNPLKKNMQTVFLSERYVPRIKYIFRDI